MSDLHRYHRESRTIHVMDVFVGALKCETEKELKKKLQERFLNVTSEELEQVIRGAQRENLVEIKDGKIVRWNNGRGV